MTRCEIVKTPAVATLIVGKSFEINPRNKFHLSFSLFLFAVGVGQHDDYETDFRNFLTARSFISHKFADRNSDRTTRVLLEI